MRRKSIAPIGRACERCGKHFSAWPFQVRDGGARFCSRACAQGPRVSLVCEQCGQTFFKPPSKVRAGRFCSGDCVLASQLRQVEHVCQHCGTAFVRPGSHPGKFCSHRCYSDAKTRPQSVRVWALIQRDDSADGCWEWQGALTDRGYATYRGLRVNRLVWSYENGPIPEGIFICHRCDNPRCCRPSHLWPGTHQDNMDDMATKGRRRTHKREVTA